MNRRQDIVAIIIVVATFIIMSLAAVKLYVALESLLKSKDSERAHRANWI